VDCLHLLTAKAFAPLEAKYFAGLVCPPNVRLGVITGNDASRIECPLIPRALTSIDAFCMSASGQFLPQQKKRLYAVGTPVKSFTDLPIGEL